MTPKPKSEFRILLVYPNLYKMLVPSLAIGIFTRVLKDEGYLVDLFETTHYPDEDDASPENRVKLLQAREFDYEKDLGVAAQTDNVFEDFRRKILDYKPDVILVSAVEDVILKTVGLLEAIEDLNIPHLVGGVFPTAAGERCFEFPVIQNIARGEGEQIIVEFAEKVRLSQPFDDVQGTTCRDGSGGIKRKGLYQITSSNDL